MPQLLQSITTLQISQYRPTSSSKTLLVDFNNVPSDCTKPSDNMAPHVYSQVCRSNFLLSAVLISYSHCFSSLLRHFLSGEIPLLLNADLSGPPLFLYDETSRSKFSLLLATQFIYRFSGCHAAVPAERQLLRKQIINGFHNEAHVYGSCVK